MREDAGDRALADDLLERLASGRVDWTAFWRGLCASAVDPAADTKLAALFADAGAFHDWAEGWRRRLATEDVSPGARAGAMRRANPAFIPRNHRVEEVLAAAIERSDFAPFETLLDVLSRPYDDQPEHAEFGEPPAVRREYRTFCGT